MKNIIRIESEQKYELNKLYENVDGREGVFACIEIKQGSGSYVHIFKVVWLS
ncbi:hypothetical protein LAX76_11880 [Listeria monocytogenes]|uniref:hypothetical protein n=1 Tax=Listeria monocytogenes TaxID=1639 RepID=UPI001E624B67|nr:hypothetical protein [Listeria monocytogenes]EGK2526735.1 hypothetical protein [Listeria monocytogenes]EHD1702302.1 hypothetical protein [Listeria monocytogenes]MCD2219559.1 hypothetical protein [Listeria monocytogenes]